MKNETNTKRKDPAGCNQEVESLPAEFAETQDIEHLAPEIKYEPRIALDGAEDGLKFYRQIIKKAADYLKEEGYLLMEMGFNQSEAIKDIINETKQFEIIETVLDYSGIERVIVLKLSNQ